jgi:asparagine synthase (glutamine-hydrolysing)
MCGICGILYKDAERRVDASTLRQMCDTMVHRGPDDEGHIVLNHVGLGMRRLAIIDLSTGHQPLTNEEKTVWIVFNGEIYNYRELRTQLEKAGHRFKTSSDTESIVHGYESWGKAVCEKLNGMFGFAIWDENERMLMLARDRLGIKPLYYYQDDEKLVFGSEIKAILQCHGIRRRVDLSALDNYLTFEYIPSPRSIFQDIRKLEPGHILVWKDNELTTRPYWNLIPQEKPYTKDEAGQHLAELLEDSVRLRLVSDVPLGAFLSGGIDSSIVVAQMARLMNQPVKTFSIGFKESSYNELPYARAVANRYGTEHHEFTVEAKALELTEKLVGQLDEPFGDFSIFPTYLVSKMARDFVTVTLSGDGGDELFAGYDTYRAHRFERRYYRHLPTSIKNSVVSKIARALPPTEKKKGIANSVKRFVQGTQLPPSLYHARWMVFLQEWEREKLFTRDVAGVIEEGDPYDFIHRHSREADGCDDVTRTGFIDAKTYLVDDILVKVDRMSMATSLEARVPYLDHRVVEFAFTLPPRLKMRGLDTKYLLKRVFWEDLPKEVQNRDKQGFSIPIKNWIRSDLKPMMLDLLDSRRIRQQGFFDEAYVSRLVDEHLKCKENHSHKLWALMVFQQWYDLYGKA